jgi:hypothetical protein
MTPIDSFFDFLLNIDIWFFVKIFYLLALTVYLVFAFMVIREVDLMNKTLKGVFNLPIKLIAYIHMVLAVLIFIAALFYL